ncbi:V-set domain-containing T-cell activation inhibitor 1 [Sphaeramia orbicularis]|uniref:V-set domain-containing T-cell activation inhibitor 1 n=1 Tax=Sphaeramia orbicularis TaxID=375764 RepID=UPI001180E0F7|nr:V-set domain-containing T-cell activation inhibitor 1 [Sphaeramia orbicularis]
MATLGQIIFYSMVILIIIFAALIILILALAFSGNLSLVQSSNKSPVANLGDSQLLSCYLSTDGQTNRIQQMSVTWEKKGLSGVVYRYQDGAADLKDQNAEFKGRTQLFTDSLMTGNASLLLMSVRSSDQGEYTCSISSSDGGGSVSVNLRTGAFSAPTFSVSDSVLTAVASRWFPEPTVTWSDRDGNVMNGSTSLTPNQNGIFRVESSVQPVNISNTYTCRIENDLKTVVSEATITASGVSEKTFFINKASSRLSSSLLSFMTCFFCIYYLI